MAQAQNILNEARGARAPQRAEQRRVIRRPGADTEEDDQFYVDPARIPTGMDYEWKRLEVFGKQDIKHQTRMARYGWAPVPASRHPEIFGRDVKEGEAGVMDGMMLMERPKQLTEEARQEELAKARENVSHQAQKLKLSTHELMPRLKPELKRRYEPAEIPPDEPA